MEERTVAYCQGSQKAPQRDGFTLVCVPDVVMRSFEQPLVQTRAEILGVAAGMGRGPVSSGALPTLSCAQVEGREVCLAVTAIPGKQWTVRPQEQS